MIIPTLDRGFWDTEDLLSTVDSLWLPKRVVVELEQVPALLPAVQGDPGGGSVTRMTLVASLIRPVPSQVVEGWGAETHRAPFRESPFPQLPTSHKLYPTIVWVSE